MSNEFKVKRERKLETKAWQDAEYLLIPTLVAYQAMTCISLSDTK